MANVVTGWWQLLAVVKSCEVVPRKNVLVGGPGGTVNPPPALIHPNGKFALHSKLLFLQNHSFWDPLTVNVDTMYPAGS